MKELPYVGTVPDSCNRCESKKFYKRGIDRRRKLARQRYCCENGHITLAPREWAFGKQFYSDSEKLLKAARMMESGRMSLQKIANQCELGIDTISKLHNYFAKAFDCVCGRPFTHHGYCAHRWSKSVKARRNLEWARHLRANSKPNAIAWAYAEKKLNEVLNMAERMEQDGGQR